MRSPEPTWEGTRKMSSIRMVRIVVLVSLCIVFIVIALNVAFWSLRKELPKPLPPDMSRCTRIEVQYWPSVLGYPVWSNDAEKNLLTSEEAQHIEMLLRYAMDDPGSISTFAHKVAAGSYAGVQSGAVSTKTVAVVLGHFNGKPPLSLMVYGDCLLVNEDKQMFSYSEPLSMFTKVTSQVQSSRLLPQSELRIRCARNLNYLYAGVRGFAEDVVYPSSSKWCDTIVERYVHRGDTEKQVRKALECPAISRGGCNYAMNRSCNVESPEDTVLLFETEEGWNQHGGAELFTFDNHDPKGGCVLLNDGTVRFIRTEEDLKQLRWK